MNKGFSCLFFLALVPLACGKAPSLEQRVVQVVEAHNRHDVALELTFYADDATFSIPGENPIVGRAALRDLFEADSIVNSELVFKDVVIHGDTGIVNSITERSDWLRLIGIPEIHNSPGSKMIFRKGLIHTVELAPFVQEDVRAYEKGWSDVMGWLSITYCDLVKEAQSGWLARYDARATQTWMKLLAEWQASKSNPKK
jgi:hypothetical protein